MTLRQRSKCWLYGTCPGFRGSFPYFGSRVYFPRGSASFVAACDQGIFEVDNVRVLQQLCRPGSHMLDVGANIGLMALPVLYQVPDCKVVSFEPSPNALPWLRRTIAESPYCGRWSLVAKAASATPGIAEFSVAATEWGLFDGLKSTGRVAEIGRVPVDVTTIDVEWGRLGCPAVSVIKVDVEGAEMSVLSGATKCMRANQPRVLLEWKAQNLQAYGCPPSALFDFAERMKYDLFAMPHLVPVRSAKDLDLQMIRTETFLLSPAAQA